MPRASRNLSTLVPPTDVFDDRPGYAMRSPKSSVGGAQGTVERNRKGRLGQGADALDRAGIRKCSYRARRERPFAAPGTGSLPRARDTAVFLLNRADRLCKRPGGQRDGFCSAVGKLERQRRSMASWRPASGRKPKPRASCVSEACNDPSDSRSVPEDEARDSQHRDREQPCDHRLPSSL